MAWIVNTELLLKVEILIKWRLTFMISRMTEQLIINGSSMKSDVRENHAEKKDSE